jgi:hypothetical protein
MNHPYFRNDIRSLQVLLILRATSKIIMTTQNMNVFIALEQHSVPNTSIPSLIPICTFGMAKTIVYDEYLKEKNKRLDNFY